MISSQFLFQAPRVLGMVLITLLLSNCAQTPKANTPSAETPEHAWQSADPKHVTVAVVGMNDFHGSLLPRERKLPDGRMVESGGAAVLASMIKRLRDEMQGRVLIVDAGDEWQGTIESNEVKGASVVDFFNQLGVDVAAIGNHEFDFNLKNMQTQFGRAKYPYVAVNIFEKATQRRPHWKNVYPTRLIEVGGIKFGVIGVTTQETPFATRYETVKHLSFADPTYLVSKESVRLRTKDGASAVLVTAHAGSRCEGGPSEAESVMQWRLWSQSIEQGSCREDEEIAKLALGLPEGTLDGIVAGHTHKIMHHWIHGIPVVQDEAYAQFFNVVYYTFDRVTKKLIPELTRIEGPVPICEQVFEGTRHCEVGRLENNDSPKLVQAKFHGKTVESDAQTLKWLIPVRKKSEKYRKMIIGKTELPLPHYREQESPLGNLVADILKETAGSDFSLVNAKGIRASLDAGDISYDAIYKALPYDNILNVLTLSGKDVKLLYRIATSGNLGIFSFSGLRAKLIPLSEPGRRKDLDEDGEFEIWETSRILELTTKDGKPIEDEKEYSVATFDYLVKGGDNYAWFMNRLKPSQISRASSAYSRDLFIQYLRRKKIVNTKAKPALDPKKPRVVFAPPRN